MKVTALVPLAPEGHSLESVFERVLIEQLENIGASGLLANKNGEAVQSVIYPGKERTDLLKVVAEYLAKKRESTPGKPLGSELGKGD